jgi:hypothetical protein
MGADVAELRANTYASIATNTGVTTHLWKFGADSSLEFPQSSYIGPLYTANDSWFVTSPVEPGGIASADGQQYIQVNNGSDVLIGTGWPLSAHEWVFDINGNLRFPDNTTQTTAFTGNPDSSKWDTAYNTATVYQTNSASYATQNYVNTNFFPLSGGTISGATKINNNLTVTGNITALGTATFNNTVFSVSSALSVVNVGPGPALFVSQSPGNFDVASFYDQDGIEVLHVGNAPSPGTLAKVGVNESFPNKELTVRGSVSATEVIYASGGSSNNWNTAYTSVQSNSASWFEPVRKFDYATVSNIDYSYSGTAPYGTADNTSIWKLIRLTYANNESISSSASAINSWTGRLTATYV